MLHNFGSSAAAAMAAQINEYVEQEECRDSQRKNTAEGSDFPVVQSPQMGSGCHSLLPK